VTYIYRTFLILVVAGLAWFFYQKHTERTERDLRVQDLRDCFEPREFAASRPPADVQTHFLQALVRLHESQLAERSLGWWKTKDRGRTWYIDEGLKALDTGKAETELLSRALENAYIELQRQDALALQENRDLLAKGKLPAATQGLFAGDPLTIGFLISPAIVPELRNHPGNFIIQPATVWALQQDVIDSNSLGTLREFVNAGLVPETTLKALRDQISPPSPASTAEKND